MQVLSKEEDPYWYKAELNGNEGFVPRNYLKMKEHSWYMGNISRTDAEAKLKRPGNQNGAFLVRKSESSPGEFSISVLYEGSVQHFKVLRDVREGTYYLWSRRFQSLNDLINFHRYYFYFLYGYLIYLYYYRSNSVSKTNTILLRSMTSEFPNKNATVQALFDFTPQEDGELAFKRGDVITGK